MTDPTPRQQRITVVGPGGLEPPIAVMVSKAERDFIDTVRRRSYELAVERGHIRR